MLVIGASGGSRIVSATLQVLVNIIDNSGNLKDSIDMPRLHHQLMPHKAIVEYEVPEELTKHLARFGHEVWNYCPQSLSLLITVSLDIAFGAWEDGIGCTWRLSSVRQYLTRLFRSPQV